MASTPPNGTHAAVEKEVPLVKLTDCRLPPGLPLRSESMSEERQDLVARCNRRLARFVD